MSDLYRLRFRSSNLILIILINKYISIKLDLVIQNISLRDPPLIFIFPLFFINLFISTSLYFLISTVVAHLTLWFMIFILDHSFFLMLNELYLWYFDFWWTLFLITLRIDEKRVINLWKVVDHLLVWIKSWSWSWSNILRWWGRIYWRKWWFFECLNLRSAYLWVIKEFFMNKCQYIDRKDKTWLFLG